MNTQHGGWRSSRILLTNKIKIRNTVRISILNNNINPSFNILHPLHTCHSNISLPTWTIHINPNISHHSISRQDLNNSNNLTKTCAKTITSSIKVITNNFKTIKVKFLVRKKIELWWGNYGLVGFLKWLIMLKWRNWCLVLDL